MTYTVLTRTHDSRGITLPKSGRLEVARAGLAPLRSSQFGRAGAERSGAKPDRVAAALSGSLQSIGWLRTNPNRLNVHCSAKAVFQVGSKLRKCFQQFAIPWSLRRHAIDWLCLSSSHVRSRSGELKNKKRVGGQLVCTLSSSPPSQCRSPMFSLRLLPPLSRSFNTSRGSSSCPPCVIPWTRSQTRRSPALGLIPLGI